MYQEITKKMDEYIALHKDEMLDVILNLAKYPSILEEGTEGAPFGKPCRECLDAAVEIMKQHGFTGGVSSDGSYGLMNYGSGDKTIGLFAHTDVVPVSPEDWIYTKPFEPKRMGDVLVGRGVEDNKAGVAASIYAVKLLEYAGLGLKNKVSVFLGSNEECGMADIEAFARENKMPDVSIVPDAGFPVSFGEKGICRAHMIIDGKFEEITEFCGGTAYNIMLDRLLVKIKYNDALYNEICDKAKDNKFLEAEKDGDLIVIRGTGLPKHAASPEGGVNAANVVSLALCECPSLCKNDRDMLAQIADLAGDFYGEKLGIACCDDCFGKLTSVNGICSLEDGVPNIALDIRYGTGITANELESRITSAYPKAYIHENKAGFAIPRDDKIAVSLERVYAELSGNPDAKGFYMGGGTYARYLRNAFSVGLQAGYIENETPELPAGHGDAHQSDEILRVNQFVEAVKIIALMLHECDKALSE
ncbi:MAG: Sapep family Mn(2+)-dependent dipeptidase [Clostridia bacterium]|nr:Sapep family Mn(2+)-dependent dipeptidase [Clostridia bacterium]